MDDFCEYFRGFNVCKTFDWHEIRINGKFVKVYVKYLLKFINLLFIYQ